MFFETPFKAKKIRKKGICLLCEKRNIRLTRDHIIPKVFGGANTSNNIQYLCVKCNEKRGSLIDVYIWKKMSFFQRKKYINYHIKWIEKILPFRNIYVPEYDVLIDIWHDLKSLEKQIVYVDESLVRNITLKIANYTKK